MKTPALLIVVVMMILPLSVMGVTPVNMGRITVDTSLYERAFTNFVPDPYISGAVEGTSQAYPKSGEMFLQAFKRKNSNQFDIYSLMEKLQLR